MDALMSLTAWVHAGVQVVDQIVTMVVVSGPGSPGPRLIPLQDLLTLLS